MISVPVHQVLLLVGKRSNFVCPDDSYRNRVVLRAISGYVPISKGVD